MRVRLGQGWSLHAGTGVFVRRGGDPRALSPLQEDAGRRRAIRAPCWCASSQQDREVQIPGMRATQAVRFHDGRRAGRDTCNSSEQRAPLPFSASTHYLVKFYSSPFLSFFLYFFWPSGAAGGIIAPRPESEPVPLAVENESKVAQSCPTLCDPVDCSPPGSSVHGLLQGIFPTQGSTQGLLHCRQSLYCLSPRGHSFSLFLLFPPHSLHVCPHTLYTSVSVLSAASPSSP